jgi:AcrR family transcriptional regulator
LPAAAGPRANQRERLLAATTAVASASGAASVTVAQVIAHAGVSRATFYENFTDIEECLVASLAPVRRRLLAGIRTHIASDRPECAATRAVHSILSFAEARPVLARLLICDAASVGGRVRCIRDELIEEAARIVEDANARASAHALIPDLPPWLIIAASCRLIAARLHDEQPRLHDLREGLPSWIAAYEAPAASHHWEAVTALRSPPRSPFLPPCALRPPLAPTSGSSRLSTRATAEDNWTRIVFATAEIVRRRGYSATTVTAITEMAGVDSRAFYRLFSGKEQALAAGCELLFRHAIAVAAGAFVSGESWQERLWEAARALSQYAGENPALAYVSLVEGDAGGRGALLDVEERTRAFTIFLRAGSHQPSGSTKATSIRPSEVALEAIAAAAFELGSRHARRDDDLRPSSLVAPLVFIALTPFVGTTAASDFVSSKALDPGSQTGLASAA